MIEFYKDIHAEKVNQSFILLNPTKDRVTDFELYFTMTVGFLMVMLILRYNHYSFVELLLVILSLVITFLLYKYREKIWYKTVLFDREKGVIQLERNFPYLRKTFPFAKTAIIRKNKKYYKHYYLKEISTAKTYLFCKTASSHSVDTIFTDYMESHEYTLEKLVDYEKENDENAVE